MIKSALFLLSLSFLCLCNLWRLELEGWPGYSPFLVSGGERKTKGKNVKADWRLEREREREREREMYVNVMGKEGRWMMS